MIITHKSDSAIRQRIEANERQFLSSYAVLAEQSKGRQREEPLSEIRTCFMRDRDRIIHSKAFRRMKQKTQVFLSPDGDHYRTRLTHTLEVSQIARTLAVALELNEDLTEAIALGHDMGHTPFGHAGEKALDDISERGFKHNIQSLRVADVVEKEGRGLNLTQEVRNGILCHTGSHFADTKEGQLVHYADRIAYLNHDIDDSIRADILTASDIPREIKEVLGGTGKKRIDTLVMGVIEYFKQYKQIGLNEELQSVMKRLREFLFERVYVNPQAKGEESKGIGIIKKLYEYYTRNKDKMTEEYLCIAEKDGIDRAVCDYVSGMTDRFAISAYNDLFVPKGWQVI